MNAQAQPTGLVGEVEYVGFWARVGASLIDSIATLGLIVVLSVWFYGDHPDTKAVLGDFTINWIVPAIAVLIFWFARGATPGKMVISAVIVDADTFGPPTPWQLVGRYLGYFVSSIPLFLGLIWVGIDARKQGWHDKMARTVVIRRRP
ncbi:MAG: RDD family protein [Betaproteobacteria bacterium]